MSRWSCLGLSAIASLLAASITAGGGSATEQPPGVVINYIPKGVQLMTTSNSSF